MFCNSVCRFPLVNAHVHSCAGGHVIGLESEANDNRRPSASRILRNCKQICVQQ